MQMSNTAVVLALHEIFDRYCVFSGGTLSLAKVEDAWKTSGLPQSHLDEGIVHLIREGHLTVELTGEGPAVKLLSYGLPGAGGEEPAPRSVVERVRSRRRSQEPPADGRDVPGA